MREQQRPRLEHSAHEVQDRLEAARIRRDLPHQAPERTGHRGGRGSRGHGPGAAAVFAGDEVGLGEGGADVDEPGDQAGGGAGEAGPHGLVEDRDAAGEGGDPEGGHRGLEEVALPERGGHEDFLWLAGLKVVEGDVPDPLLHGVGQVDAVRREGIDREAAALPLVLGGHKGDGEGRKDLGAGRLRPGVDLQGRAGPRGEEAALRLQHGADPPLDAVAFAVEDGGERVVCEALGRGRAHELQEAQLGGRLPGVEVERAVEGESALEGVRARDPSGEKGGHRLQQANGLARRLDDLLAVPGGAGEAGIDPLLLVDARVLAVLEAPGCLVRVLDLDVLQEVGGRSTCARERISQAYCPDSCHYAPGEVRQGPSALAQPLYNLLLASSLVVVTVVGRLNARHRNEAARLQGQRGCT